MSDECPVSETRLDKLPKGSSCQDWKDAPARSDYWKDDTDSVTRCSKWATGGDGGRDDPPSGDGAPDGGTVTYEGVEAPKRVSGWEITDEYSFDGIDGRDEHNEYLIWEKFGTDNSTAPRINRTLLVLSYKPKRRGTSGHQTALWNVDVNGNKEASTIDDPDKPRSDPEDAVSAAVEYMEENPEEIPDYSDRPTIDARGEARNVKYMATHVNRVAGDGSSKFNIRFEEEGIRAFDNDVQNVYLTDTKVSSGAFESYSVSEGWTTINPGRFYDMAREANVTDEIRLVTKESEETAVPPYLDIEIEGESQTSGLKRVWVFEPKERMDVPDLDFETSIETTGKEFKRIYKGSTAVEPINEAIGLHSDGDRAYMVVRGDVDRFRGEFDPDKTDVSGATEGSWYSKKYMKQLRMIRQPASTNVTVRTGETHPLEVTYHVNNHYQVMDLLAPRVDSDGSPADVELSECPIASDRDTYELAEPLESGEEVPEVDGMGLHEGDTVVWTFPKADGCRCGAQALQYEQLAEELGVPVFGIAATSPEDLNDMAERYDLESITLIADPEGQLASEFGVELSDGKLERTTMFVREGRVTDVSGGVAPPEISQPNESGCPIERVSDPIRLAQKNESKLYDSIEHPSVYVITGSRGSGKSALAHRLGEQMAEKEDIVPVAVGVPKHIREKYPSQWVHVDDMDDAPGNSVTIIDEAYLKFHARQSQKKGNLKMGAYINTSRHCDRTIMFVSQNSGHVDKMGVSEADGILVKEPGTFHKEFERAEIRDITERAEDSFEQLPEDTDNRKYVYTVNDNFEGMVQNDKPEWYDDEVSKSYGTACKSAEPAENAESADD